MNLLAAVTIVRSARRAAGAFLLSLLTWSTSVAQTINFDAESYYIFDKDNNGATHELTWASLRARFNDHWRLVASDWIDDYGLWLDENFVEYTADNVVAKAGRIRGAFGLSDWYNERYNVVARDPMIRSMPLLSHYLVLDRDDDGVEVQTNVGIYQLAIDAVDVRTGILQFVPKSLNRVQARGQVQLGPALIGASVLTTGSGPLGKGTVVGLDARWTGPQWRLKGEAVSSIGDSLSADGYYADITFRPRQWYRTEFGAREEAYEIRGSGGRSTLTTFGVRQIVGPNLTFNLNYGFGKAYGEAADLCGWSLQTMVSIHF